MPALQVKYRPKDFNDIIGNEETVSSLKTIFLREKDLPHVYLFNGPKGCGKTTLGRIVAEKLLQCNTNDCVDFKQIDGGDIKAETVKELKKEIRYKPFSAKARVWLIEEAHMMGSGGSSEKNIIQNNMLTTLEEPPEHVYFILCTTDPQRLLETIHSRSHIFTVKPLNDDDMAKLINKVLKEEGVQSFPNKAINKIIDTADGCPRDALKILDQVIDIENDDEVITAVDNFVPVSVELNELCQLLLKSHPDGSFGKNWSEVQKVLNKLQKKGDDAEKIRRGILGYMTKVLMNSQKKRGQADIGFRCKDLHEIFRQPTYNNGLADIIFCCYEASV